MEWRGQVDRLKLTRLPAQDQETSGGTDRSSTKEHCQGARRKRMLCSEQLLSLVNSKLKNGDFLSKCEYCWTDPVLFLAFVFLAFVLFCVSFVFIIGDGMC